MSPRLALLAAVAVLALPACSVDLGSSTEGELGRATFSYSSCFFGCAVDHPVLAGATARVSVAGDGLPELTAVSSDVRVLQVIYELPESNGLFRVGQQVDAYVAARGGKK